MLFRDQPKLLFTGLTEIIGMPREYERNLDELSYFEKNHCLKIPLQETN